MLLAWLGSRSRRDFESVEDEVEASVMASTLRSRRVEEEPEAWEPWDVGLGDLLAWDLGSRML